MMSPFRVVFRSIKKEKKISSTMTYLLQIFKCMQVARYVKNSDIKNVSVLLNTYHGIDRRLNLLLRNHAKHAPLS